jgi:tRNA(fMet)-specific endonuclease VapC
MTLWILDTDHISLILRGSTNPCKRLSNCSPFVATTIISVQEVFNGWVGELNQPGNNRDRLIGKYRQLFLATELFKSVQVLEFDAKAFDCYESLLLQNPELRKKRLQQDLRIAAIALAQKAVVVTRNNRDFNLVPGLSIENWT